LKEGKLDLSERVRHGVDFVKWFRSRDMTMEAIREISSLCVIGKKVLAYGPALMDAALDLRLQGVSQDLLEVFATTPNPPTMYHIYRIHSLGLSDPGAARKLAAQVATMESDNPEFWDRLSILGALMGESKTSVIAAKKFFAVTRGSASSRKRLAWALATAGKRWSALRQLKTLVNDPDAKTGQARHFSQLALDCGDRALSLRFAEIWEQACPDDPEAVFLCSFRLREFGNRRRATEVLERLVTKIEAGMSLDRKAFAQTLDMARDLDDAMARRVALMAYAKFPDEADFAVFAKPDAFFGKLFVQPK
jgi:hypothetical protein